MIPLALTMGEPAGIGAEIALMAWRRRAEGVPPFFLLDDVERLAGLARHLGWAVPIKRIAAPEEAVAAYEDHLPVLPVALPRPVIPGQPDAGNAGAVVAAIDAAVAFAGAGRAGAIVTNPINKQVLYAAGFKYPGHTEYLAALAGGVTPVMMLACPELRVVPVTIHLALKAAAAALTSDAIIAAGRITAAGLRCDFAISRPVLAVAALNPHAGESGALGREEIEIIAPAIAALRREGIEAIGPFPADTLFHAAARKRYDAVLCMYHDQALIPIKTVDFDGGVNVTLGLPFIRTSPDHGTAFDIAGTGSANPTSLIAALKLAGAMAARRAGFQATAA